MTIINTNYHTFKPTAKWVLSTLVDNPTVLPLHSHRLHWKAVQYYDSFQLFLSAIRHFLSTTTLLFRSWYFIEHFIFIVRIQEFSLSLVLLIRICWTAGSLKNLLHLKLFLSLLLTLVESFSKVICISFSFQSKHDRFLHFLLRLLDLWIFIMKAKVWAQTIKSFFMPLATFFSTLLSKITLIQEPFPIMWCES